MAPKTYLTEYDPQIDHDIYVMVNLGSVCDPSIVLRWLEPLVNDTQVRCKFTILFTIEEAYFLLLCPNEKKAQIVLNRVMRYLRGKATITGFR